MAEEATMIIEGEDGRNWLTGPPLATIPRAGELVNVDGKTTLRVTAVEHIIRLEKSVRHIITVKVRPA